MIGDMSELERLALCVPSLAYWDATRAFMILSLLACFIGIVIGVMAFIHYSSFDGFDKTFAAGILFFISCEYLIIPILYRQLPLRST